MHAPVVLALRSTAVTVPLMLNMSFSTGDAHESQLPSSPAAWCSAAMARTAGRPSVSELSSVLLLLLLVVVVEDV